MQKSIKIKRRINFLYLKRFIVVSLSFLIFLSSSKSSYAFFGGGGGSLAQIPYLVKILAENVKRYQQLRLMIETAQGHKQYLELINAGLDNSIGLLESLPVRDENILVELRSFKKSYNTILETYGQIPESKETLLHTLHDQTVAESLRMVNSFKEFTREQEENSVILKTQAQNASPKGAARMQVEASSDILKSLNQLIRLNSQMLKMQSELLAMSNKTGKDSVSRFQKVNRDLKSGFKKVKFDMDLIKY